MDDRLEDRENQGSRLKISELVENGNILDIYMSSSLFNMHLFSVRNLVLLLRLKR